MRWGSFIAHLLGGRPIAEPVLAPPRFSGPTLPPEDAPEEPHAPPPTHHHEAHEDVSQRAFIIDYRDAAGAVSHRRIVAFRVYKADRRTYVQARCLERNATRTFRLDRIIDVFSGVTGEDLGKPSLVFLPDDAGPAPRRMAPKEIAIVRRALRVLMTVARADGVLRPEEGLIIRGFVSRALPGLPDEPKNDLIAYAMELAPSFESFLASADAVGAADARLAIEMANAAVAMAKADGATHEQETRLIGDLQAMLTGHGIAFAAAG